MKRILLTTVAVLPLLAVGVWPASSQDVKQPGVSQSQGAGAQGKKAPGSQGAAKSLTQGTQGHAQPAPSGNDKNAQSGENKSVGQANEPGKNAVTEGQNTAGQGPGKESRGVRNQTPSQTKGARNPTQTTSQSNRNKPQQTTGQSKQEQPSTTGQNQRQQPSTTGQNQRENTQQNQSTQQNQQGANRTEGGQGSVTLNEQQRTRIQQTVLSGRNVPREDRVDFSINVGTTVPTRVRVVAVPRELIDIHPEWRGDEYFVVRDDIIIVDHSHRIVAMVPVGSSSSSVETRSSTASFESPDEIREVQQVLIEKGFLHGRVDGIMGRETVAALIEFQRKEGIEASGHIDERTMTALGVSGKTEGQGGRQSVQPGQNQPGQNQPGQNNAGQNPGQNRQGTPSTSGQGGNQNQPSANPGNRQNNPGQTNGQGGNQNQPSANPGSTSGQGGNQPSANPSGGQSNGRPPAQNQPGKDDRRQ